MSNLEVVFRKLSKAGRNCMIFATIIRLAAKWLRKADSDVVKILHLFISSPRTTQKTEGRSTV